MKKNLLLFTSIIGLVLASIGPAHAYEFQIDNLTSSMHDGEPTVEFTVTGSTASKYSNCEALISVNPVLRVIHGKGIETLPLNAAWGSAVETQKVLANGLQCKARAMARVQYAFAGNESRMVHDLELVFGQYSKRISSITMLNRQAAPTPPQIILPTRASNTSEYLVLRFDKPFHQEFAVRSIQMEICKISDVCFTAPYVALLAKDGMSAEVIFDAQALKGESIDVSLTWWFTNALGKQNFARSKVVLNSIGANPSFKPKATFLKRFQDLKLAAEPRCKIVKSAATCSVKPEFRATMKSAVSSEGALPIPFTTTALVQTSLDSKSWKTIRRINLDTRKTTSFTAPVQLNKKENYIRVVPSGVNTKVSWDWLGKGFDY